MTQDADTGVCLVLEGALTMRTIDTVHATLRAAIEALSGVPPSNVAIDCSAATETDLTFVQLLIATRISANAIGHAVSLATIPDGALLDTLSRGGFVMARESGGFWFEGAAV
jgi:ABC-type transporter Mla MlaB component